MLFRCSALFLCTLSCGYSSKDAPASALTPSDQLPIKYTALFGGEAQISAMTVDSAGNAYLAGQANSALPVTPGAFQTVYDPGTCTSYFPNSPQSTYRCPVAFAGKLNHEGTALVYLTYLGASNISASGIDVDGAGNAWVTGSVFSADLPVTAGAPQPNLKGDENAFVLKLNATGSQVLFATYLGGAGSVTPTSLATDAGGNDGFHFSIAVDTRPNHARFSWVSWRIVARGGIVLMMSSISTKSCSLLKGMGSRSCMFAALFGVSALGAFS